MVTAGLYETSGDWLYDTGLPGKSGIGSISRLHPGNDDRRDIEGVPLGSGSHARADNRREVI